MRFNLPRHSIPWTPAPSSSKVIFFRYLLVSCDCVYRLFVQRVIDLIKLLSPLELPSLAFVIVLIALELWLRLIFDRLVYQDDSDRWTFLPCYFRDSVSTVSWTVSILRWSSLCLFQFSHTLRHNATLCSNFDTIFCSRHLVSAVNSCSYGSEKKLIFIRHIPCIGLLTAKTLIWLGKLNCLKVSSVRPNNQVQKRWKSSTM